MNEYIKSLVIKYVTGDADESEQLFVRQWIRESQDNMDYFISLKETWQDSLNLPSQRIVQPGQAFNRLQERLQPQPVEIPAMERATGAIGTVGTIERATGATGLSRLFYPGRVAIAILLLFASGAIGIGLYRKVRPAAIPQAAFEIFVPNGKMKKLILPDSTEVWLNAGTHFRYASGFGVSGREVFLEGEGYFAVHHDEKVPFVVRAGGYVIRDIGTIFTINAYPGNKNFEAAVIEGKVEVSGNVHRVNTGNSILLAPHQVLKIREQAGPSSPGDRRQGPVGAYAADTGADRRAQSSPQVISSAPMEKYEGWKDNLLVFDEESFGDVARRLERTYNVKIRINCEQLAHLRYTGKFNKVQTITDALKIIRETTPVLYRMEGDSVIISVDKRAW